MKKILAPLLVLVLVLALAACGQEQVKEETPEEAVVETSEGVTETEEPDDVEVVEEEEEEEKEEAPKTSNDDFLDFGESSPEKVVTALFENMKKMDLDKMKGFISRAELKASQEYLEDMDEDTLEEMQQESAEDQPYYAFMKEQGTKLQFEVQNAVLEGDSGVVPVKATFVNAREFYDHVIGGAAQKSVEFQMEDREMEVEERNAFMKDLMEEMEGKEYPTEEIELEIPVVKENGKWYIKELDMETNNVIYTGMFSSMLDTLKQFESMDLEETE